MKQYHEMLKHILQNGVEKTDRTGTGTISVFGYQNRFNLSEGFPLVTTKKVFFKAVVHELLWFISGQTRADYLKKHNITIWDEWTPESGELGPVYGHQWRKFMGPYKMKDGNSVHYEKVVTGDHGQSRTPLGGVDQLHEVIQRIKTKPDDRRLIVSAWNPMEVEDQALPACHSFFQFYVANGKLSCHLYQRSADSFLGVPFNIASYALLTHMVASVADLGVGDFVHTFGDLHVYKNHVEQVKEQLTRTPKPLPRLILSPWREINKFTYEDVTLGDYNPDPSIKAEVAV